MKKYISLLSAIVLFTAACSDDKDEWMPGAPDAANSPGVYFDTNNPADVILVPEDPTAVTITMHRVVATNAIDVPIIVTCSAEGLQFPNTVHFDAGQTTATFDVDITGLQTKVMVKYNITVPDEYLFLYNDSHYNSHNGSILISAWEPANEDNSPVTFYFCEYDYVTNNNVTPKASTFQPVESQMEVLPGANLYRIHNFMGGDSDFRFSLQASQYSKYSGLYRIVPHEDNYWTDEENYGEAYYHMWYLCTDSEDEDEAYGTYYLNDINGEPTSFEYPCFYWYSDANSAEYCYARLAGTPDSEGVAQKYCSATLWFADVTSDTKLPNYMYLYFRWDKSAF